MRVHERPNSVPVPRHRASVADLHEMDDAEVERYDVADAECVVIVKLSHRDDEALECGV